MKAPLCKLADIPDSGAARIDFFGREALVYKVEGSPEPWSIPAPIWAGRSS